MSLLTIKASSVLYSSSTSTSSSSSSEHFVEDGHDFDRDLELYMLESGRWRSAGERKKRESFDICKFATLEPAGLNKTAGIMGQFYGSI